MGMYFESQPKLDTKICCFRAKEAMLFIGFGYCLVACVMLFGPGYYTFAAFLGVAPFICFCCSSLWTFILICVNSKCAYGCYGFFTLMMATVTLFWIIFYLTDRHQFYSEEFPKAKGTFLSVSLSLITTASHILLFINCAVAISLNVFCSFVYCRLSYFDRFNDKVGVSAGGEQGDIYEVSAEGSSESEEGVEFGKSLKGLKKAKKSQRKSFNTEDTL